MIPEREAALRIAAAISPHLQSKQWVQPAAVEEFCQKLVASPNRALARSIFDELDADPNAVPERGVVLRRQPTAALDQFDWHLEQAAEAKAEWAHHCEAAEQIRRSRLAEQDPDEAGARDDERRISQERRDFAATDAAPRWQDAAS